MKISNQVLSVICYVLAACFAVAAVYELTLAGRAVSAINCAVLALLNSIWGYRLSHRYRSKYSADRLIRIDDDDLVICQPGVGKAMAGNESGCQRIQLKRLSVISVGESYLGVIIDENGQGFDFYLPLDKESVYQRLDTLLATRGKGSVILQRV